MVRINSLIVTPNLALANLIHKCSSGDISTVNLDLSFIITNLPEIQISVFLYYEEE
ncbi:hypothetical protein CP10139811_1498 [Chlamydia ibidis]|uniref:Uncharacterized protein n=1 Tax=Chlamydia ibidis TaxID=1405396 RepID=S7J5R8_9CHLA|nr:hypothetical protein CP10139811_1498 [Chlamydia ibidis]